MLRHLKREYYKKYKRSRVVNLLLFILISLFFGFLGGLLALNVNSDFLYWLKNNVIKNKNSEIVNIRQYNNSSIVEDANTISVVKDSLASTVNIVISKEVNSYYNQTGTDIYSLDFFTEEDGSQPSEPGVMQKRDIGGGSGFIISKDGLIVTNKHVIFDDNAEYSVILSNGERFDAKVIAKDPLIDLAILKIEADNLPVLKLGDSDTLSLGQTVIAIGFTLSEYNNTVTKGVVSGIERKVTAEGEILDAAIQTDAAINPGSSGGPLINLSGEVIGINTAVSNEGQSIGFALPINSAKQAIESVQIYGRIVRPWLGVRYILLNEELSRVNKLPVDYGALLVRGKTSTDFAVIPNSPADKSGLEEGDIILEVNSKKIDQNNFLAKLIAVNNVGDVIKLKILRQGKEQEFKIILEEFNQDN